MTKHRLLVTLLPMAVIAAACAASKSADPLSPTIAGPIPGVNITAPTPVDPNIGTQVSVDRQPVTLTVQNATTNSPRPLNYLFEVATDNGFANKVFSLDGVAPGDGGRTALRLPSPLTTGHTYYWRSRAQDGANTGPYSGASYFTVFTPVVINQPTPLSPVNNLTVSNTSPTFVIANASRSGPVGPITYTIEVAEDGGFTQRVAVWAIAEQPNQTSLPSPQALAYGKQYFWHVRAADAANIGPWSVVTSFVTPAPPAPAPPPPSGGQQVPTGNWQSCTPAPAGSDQQPLVQCIKDSFPDQNVLAGACGAFEIVKRVAWQLRGQNGGLRKKSGGSGCVWNGQLYSSDIIAYPDGTNVDMLQDAGGQNNPTWFVYAPDPSVVQYYQPAIQP